MVVMQVSVALSGVVGGEERAGQSVVWMMGLAVTGDL